MFKHISIIFLLIFFMVNTYSQDLPKSVGPAPVKEYKSNQNGSLSDNDLAIGDRYWIYLSSSPTFQLQKGTLESCSPMTNIGVPFTVTFPGALVYKQGTILMNNQSSPWQIYSIDTVTGVHTLYIPSLSGVPQANFTGMTWDGTNLYGVSTTLAVSQIFIINGSTATPIGAPTAVCAGAISISASPTGELFSVDLTADNLYKWNKVTGAATLIGPLGVNANFGQDAQFDWKDTTLYWAAYTSSPGLYKINFNTGAAAFLCSYPAQVTGIAIANPPAPPIPLCEQFASTQFPPVQWSEIFTGTNYWSRVTQSAFGLGVGSAKYDMWDAPDGTTQTLTSPLIISTNPVNNTDTLVLDEAYQPYGTTLDSLIILGSTDGGNTYPVTIARASYLQLATATGSPSPFVPTASQWGKRTYALAGNINRIQFKGVSAFGDNLYLDSICIIYHPVGIINTNTSVPSVYSLSQNYPNPFNPSTVISYGLPKAGNVKLIIYDILGREVKTLVNEFKQAGNYNINFDGLELASGIYFYSITANDFTETKKMLMVK